MESDDSGDGNPIDGANEEVKLLYPGARISEEDTIASVFHLWARHTFTIPALKDVLKLLTALLENFPPFLSVYRLLKNLRSAPTMGNCLTKHSLCSTCGTFLHDEKSTCTNGGCIEIDPTAKSFVMLDIEFKFKHFAKVISDFLIS